MIEKLKYVRDEIFGPNSSLYECTSDSEMEESFRDFEESCQRIKKKCSVAKWAGIMLDVEHIFWEREGMYLEAKPFLKEIKSRLLKAIRERRI